jgi:nitrate/nitrite-specific signal transduction histidine kinase
VVVAVGGLLAVDRVAEEVVERRDSELARVSAGRLADRLASLPEPLEDLARAAPLRGGSESAIQPLLAGARGGQLESFDIGLLAYDTEGVVVASDPPWLALLPQWLQFPDRSQLRVVTGERRAALSSVFRDPFTGVDFVVVAVPVVAAGGEIAAVLAGGISLDAPLLAAVAELRAGSSGSAFLVDEGGWVIYHRDPALVGQLLTELPSVQAAVEGRTGAAVGAGSQGERTISGFAPVTGTGWGVVTEESWDEVVAPIRRTVRIALLVLALGGALSGVLLWVVVRRMLRPLDRLAEGADRIAAGDLAHRVDTDTDEELAALGGRFNAMADTLADSYASLERRVEERTAENRRLYEEAAQRGEELRELNQRALAVADVAQQVGSLTRLDALLPAVEERLRDAFGYTAVDVYLTDEESGDLVTGAGEPSAERRYAPGAGAVGRAAATGECIVIDDLRAEPSGAAAGDDGSRSELAVPIGAGSLVVGVLDIRSTRPAAFDDADRFTAETFADQLAVAIENARLFEQTQDLAVLEERNRFAREIHDTIAQGLIAIVLQMEAMEDALGDDPEAALAHLNRARDLARECLQDARRSVWNLLPEHMVANSLDEALDREIARFLESGPEDARLVVSGRPRALSREAQTALLRIGQEALTNVRKHAGASSVEVEVAYLPGEVRLRVRDNGRGVALDPASGNGERGPRGDGGGFGLGGMRQRARQLFGSVEVGPGESGGTVVEAVIPAS